MTHDLFLPTLLFAALGGMTWAVRGCSGFGATAGCIFAGAMWGAAWWFIAHDPTREQSRRYAGPGATGELPTEADNQAIQRLNAQLATGEAKLRELASQYGPNYPLYQRQVAQNQALRERLAGERQRATAGAASVARQSRAPPPRRSRATLGAPT